VSGRKARLEEDAKVLEGNVWGAAGEVKGEGS
jgi:hypothetical protein